MKAGLWWWAAPALALLGGCGREPLSGGSGHEGEARTAVVSGTVNDSVGQPLADFVLHLLSTDFRPQSGVEQIVLSDTTDSSGRFAFIASPDTVYVLSGAHRHSPLQLYQTGVSTGAPDTLKTTARLPGVLTLPIPPEQRTQEAIVYVPGTLFAVAVEGRDTVRLGVPLPTVPVQLATTPDSATALTSLAFTPPAHPGECLQWQTQHPEWLWCDDFEILGSFEDFYEDFDLESAWSRSADDAFDGSYALRHYLQADHSGRGWLTRVDHQGYPDHLFVRWYHKFEPGFTDITGSMVRARFRPRSGTWEPVTEIRVGFDRDTALVDLKALSSTQASATGYLPRAMSSWLASEHLGRWVCFELELALNAPGASDGLVRLWADTVLIAEAIHLDLRGIATDKLNEIMIDGHWSATSPLQRRRYLDNFVVSSERIGPHQ